MVLALSELEWKTMEENFYLTANLFGRGLYLLLYYVKLYNFF